MHRSYFFALLLIAFIAAMRVSAQETQSADVHEGVLFEVAFGVVWPASIEKELPKPFRLCITSRQAGAVTVEYGPRGSRTSESYDVAAQSTTIIPIPTSAAKSTTEGGVEATGITVMATSPITVITQVNYENNRNAILHYPVATWGRGYHTFNYKQDRYGPEGNAYYRPGQIVVVASQDSTLVTFTSPVAIRAKGLLNDTVTAKKPVTMMLMAHETLTLLSKINVYDYSWLGTDLTGTQIVSTKPVAVLAGHTKSQVGYYSDVLPYAGIFKEVSSFIRTGFCQSMLPDDFADTAFVTVPLIYNGGRFETPDTDDHEPLGDMIRVLALQNNTIVRRTKADGTGLLSVDTLNAGQVYDEWAADSAYRWITSKPCHVMQYGKSWFSFVQSTERMFMPTMMVIPGLSRWVHDGAFAAPVGIDNFLSVVVRTADTAAIQFNNRVLADSVDFTPIMGTDLSCVSMPIDTGSYTVRSTSPKVAFMGWSYGSIDSKRQGGSYGRPIAVNLPRPCADSIAFEVMSTPSAYIGKATLSSPASCSKFSSHEIVSSKNAIADSLTVSNDTIVYYLARLSADSVGQVQLRFVTTSGTVLQRTLNLSMNSATRREVKLLYTVRTSKIERACRVTITTLNPIPTDITHCLVTISYDSTRLRPEDAFEQDTTIGHRRYTTYRVNLSTHDANKDIAFFEYTAIGSPLTIHQPTLDSVVWYQGTILRTNVSSSITTTVIDDDTVSTDVSGDLSHSANTTDCDFIEVIPQPVHDVFTIAFGKGLQRGFVTEAEAPISLRLYDMNGVVVADFSDRIASEHGTVTVSTSRFAAGVYLLQVQNGSASCSRRVIIE